MGKKLERELFYLDGVWQNIRHNENIRNRLFHIHLIISGSFLFVIQENSVIKTSQEAALAFSFFVWLIGVFFLWAYERIREMINRDNKIVGHLNKGLKDGSEIEKKIYSELNSYKKTIKTTSLSWYSISSCINFSTSLISSLIISVAIRQQFNLNWLYVLIMMVGTVLVNSLLIKLINKLAKIKQNHKKK